MNIGKEKNNSEMIPIKPNKTKLNQMTIIYQINKKGFYTAIFGYEFVENNKNNCYLLIDNQQRELCEYLNLNKEEKDILEIKLIENRNITNMSYMFNHKILWSFFYRYKIISLPDISEWDAKNVTDMSHMFYGCSSLESLPDISKWDTKNVTNMSWMFCDCSSLKSLPDISKWELNKKLNKVFMFELCNERIIPEKFKESKCFIY